MTPQKAELFFRSPAVFRAGADCVERLPREGLPEIAFIGRSNVGKSSLVNALVGQKMLARVSNTPGRTQQLNFFTLADRLSLVDMPGYGYAEAAKTKVNAWNELIDIYLAQRGTLKRLCLLIDSRHGIKDNDAEFMDMLNKLAVPFLLVLTKQDKVKASEAAAVTAQMVEVLKGFGAAWPQPFATSAETGAGIGELRQFLAQYAY